MPADFRSSLTVLNFLSGATPLPASSHDSQLSLRAKAATLFERATHLASQWSTGELLPPFLRPTGPRLLANFCRPLHCTYANFPPPNFPPS